MGVAFDEHFGWAHASVVVGTEGETVGSGVQDCEEFSGFCGWQSAIAGEEIAGFADGADDVYRLPCCRAGWLADRENLVVGLVECGADEVVHGGVCDDEGLVAILFDVDHGCD